MENKMSFEEAYKKLEEIAIKLESPDITLDESIALFDEGMKLSKYCSEVLQRAKQKIEMLESREKL